MKLPCFFTVFMLLGLINQVVAFSMICSKGKRGSIVQMTAVNNHGGMDRRSAILRTLALTSTLPIIGNSSPVYAKEKEPITVENVSSAFSAIRYELESPEGGVSQLTTLIEAEDFPAVMEFAKNYDLDFRKLKMGRARKLLTDPSLKDGAVLNCNAVTFDLIGVNRSSRKGQENRDEALKYVGELRADIEKFLEYEKTIVIPKE